jgi:hypothetical protein
VGDDPATGERAIFSYATGTPYGTPVYYYNFYVHNQFGNNAKQIVSPFPYYTTDGRNVISQVMSGPNAHL